MRLVILSILPNGIDRGLATSPTNSSILLQLRRPNSSILAASTVLRLHHLHLELHVEHALDLDHVPHSLSLPGSFYQW
jgi:hypothetical protein